MRKRWLTSLIICLCVLAGPVAADVTTLSPDARAAYERAQRALIASDLVSVEREITRALELAPDYPPLYDIYRTTLRTPEQTKAARERYAALVEQEPGRLAYWFIHGRLAEEIAERERIFSKVVEMDPKGPWGHYGLAWVARSKQDEPDRALALYEKAHAAAPDEPAITSTLVGFLAFRALSEEDSPKTGAWRARAVKLFEERLVAKAPESYHTYTAYMPVIQVSQGKQAVAYAERFLKLFPKSQFAVSAHNVVLADLVTRDEAATVARAKAALAELASGEANPLREMLFSDFVFAPTAKKGVAAVDALAMELLASSERSSGIFYTVGARYAVEGDTTIGVKLLARALELSAATPSPLAPPDAIRVALGRAYLRAGDAARAAATLDAVTTGEYLAAAAGAAADAYAKLGSPTKVYEATVRAAAVSPTPEIEKRLADAAKTAGKTAEEAAAAVWATRDRIAKPAADFTLTALDGTPLTLSSLRGKIVLLNFWFPG